MRLSEISEGAETLLFRIPEPLVSWYRGCARDLPWRRTQDPYRVWISEIMLQQTRVEAVRPYYERFLSRCPDPRSLAELDEGELLKLWEGLGYYSRARHLRAAAVRIAAQGFPARYRELLHLPGIGPYTAAAVSSICFGEPSAAVDGNVLRVCSRLLCLETDPASPALRSALTEALDRAMPQGREALGPGLPPTPFGQLRNDAGDFNQGMMELGARVCLPKGAPLCGGCPLSGLCRAHALGTETSYPVHPPKKVRRIEDRTVFVLRFGQKYALRRRPASGLLAGLWEFPSLEGRLSAAEAAGILGCPVRSLRPLGEAKHVFTHLEWHMTGWLAEPGRLPDSFGELTLASPEELEERYALPSALEAYLRRVREIKG